VKVAIVSGLWGRYPLALPWWHGMTRIQRHWQARGVDCEIVVSGSESLHYRLCEPLGGHWAEAPNAPLGFKLNAAAQLAYHRDADYLLITGCDDFLAPRIIDIMANRVLRDGAKYVGLSGCWFYDLATGRTCLFEEYATGHIRRGEPVGLGRMIHRSLLPADGRPWENQKNRGMDHSMSTKCKLPPASIVPVGELNVAVDVKTAENLWSYEHMANSFRLRTRVDPPEMRVIPEWDMIQALRLPAAA
jgi:hypothetical protein